MTRLAPYLTHALFRALFEAVSYGAALDAPAAARATWRFAWLLPAATLAAVADDLRERWLPQ